MPWTDDKVSQLRELWDQGLPTSQIGKILNFTKNAVVGKAHRIGLERRPSPIKRSIMKPDRKKARAPLMPDLNFNLKSDKDFEHQADNQNNQNNELKEKLLSKDLIVNGRSIGCEWPIGHPNEISFHYCGSERIEGKPYCSKHCEQAYIMPEKLKAEEVLI
ncbi:MAG: hypothetical protein CFH21_00571 [Alphaproteobacteria bacterium MarineAlpha5_Bin11]|nr:hypothetical protein [Pelagibacteraceae bacterium]PPR44010.1 MAG: hypothetical protein CFH21_00571 [Alphaproteobacteria bacterium MarineAlpha5_Bin11]PPR51231.1 MAG: hypothetical protein CFH20_00760 [Alphaproteobacteria bacterium MarineAlpha5_Bin10]|tara:strand:+ start:355 stop:837 length:483 start_codon:yes stop_codon:yes gene_type:complete